jgi:hypothetical protein
MLLLPVAARAQSAPRALPKPDAEFSTPFVAISGLRPLRDGRVIVSDAREGTLQLIDFASGKATPIGRKGAGPREWTSLGSLVAAPGDSTILFDFANGRLLMIHPDGTPGRTEPEVPNDPFWDGTVLGFDASGRALLVVDRRAARPIDGTSGIADVLRYDRRTKRIDTVGTLVQPKGEQSMAKSIAGGLLQMSTNLPLAATDLAALAPDGRAVFVRAKPYRVEYVAPNGARTMGPVAVASNVPVTASEKEAFLRSQIRPGAIFTRVNPGAGTTPAGGAPNAPRPKAPSLSKAELDALEHPAMTWPAIKPPFLDRAVRVAPDGRVWVLRTRAHTDSIPTFDVFDATGRVVDRVAIPARTRLVGFGQGVAYLARTDDDEAVWLQRVRLTPQRAPRLTPP